ncbi:MAG: hypothetical protein KGK05_10630 [Xanthomonadaceae bacterium]|nr:hypothetical protein [Xanthomonadaceae bacterium]
MSKLVRFALVAVLAAAGFGCNQQQNAANPAAPAAAVVPATPDAAIAASIKALRDNNVAALVDNALPVPEVAKLKADWNKDLNAEPITDEDRKEFSERMATLTAPDAEAKMYAQIQPKLAEFDKQSAQQMPMMIAMGQGFAKSAIAQNKDLSDAQKKQAEDLLDATAQWAQTTKFTDPVLVKAAIAQICKTARALNLKSADEARALSYEQAMQKAGVVLAGVKAVLAVYGLNVDQALDSVKLDPVAANGDAATVKLTYTAFGKPFTTEAQMVRVDGRWYGKHAIDQWHKHEAEIASAAAKPAPPENANALQAEIDHQADLCKNGYADACSKEKELALLRDHSQNATGTTSAGDAGK